MEGEWSSFNTVCVNEEADFMAELFPNSNNNVDLTYGTKAGACYSSDCTSNDPQNLYYYSQENPYNNNVLNGSQYHHQASANYASSSLPIDFLASDQTEGDDDGLGIEITLDTAPDEKNSDSKKRSRSVSPVGQQTSQYSVV